MADLFRPRRPFRLGLAWLLSLALLLPAAQSAALWHGLSHLAPASPTAAAGGKHLLHDGQCALCLAAAAVTGGALPSTPAPAVVVALRPHRVAMVRIGTVGSTEPPVYRSRAPPTILN